jgi:hypothetical protein
MGTPIDVHGWKWCGCGFRMPIGGEIGINHSARFTDFMAGGLEHGDSASTPCTAPDSNPTLITQTR